MADYTSRDRRVYPGINLDELFGRMGNEPPKEGGTKDANPPPVKGKYAKKREEIQWRGNVYQGDELILDHAQSDYNKVMRFLVNALIELHNQNCEDYRITIADNKGNLRFFAIGPKTELATYKKEE